MYAEDVALITAAPTFEQAESNFTDDVAMVQNTSDFEESNNQPTNSIISLLSEKSFCKLPTKCLPGKPTAHLVENKPQVILRVSLDREFFFKH